jgi:serine/threonine protein kinase
VKERLGRYHILGELGRGGMGVVYRGREPNGREVALKVLANTGDNEVAQRRFRREVASLLRLTDPHVVRLLEANLDGEQPWFAMELVEGQTLADTIQARGPLPSEEVINLGLGLSQALAAAHTLRIAHRDVKPENVLMRPDGRAVLTDFGLTKDLEVSESLRLSRTGALSGTPAYWSPEQAAGDQ